MSDDLLDFDDHSSPLSARDQLGKGYNGMLSLFGGAQWLPSSLMAIANKVPVDDDLDEHAADRNYRNSIPTAARKALDSGKYIPRRVRRAMKDSGKGSLSGALSKFPQMIGRTVTLFYTEPGDTVVDPFAGHNSRMDLCVKAGRDYIGCDLSGPFMEFNYRRAEVLRKQYPNAWIRLYCCDSRKQEFVESGVGDFTITSPPYWDIEWYGDEEEQLGKINTYEEFMNGMEGVLRENFRTLKSGAYSVWFVNDFRKDGRFYFYHMDILDRGRRAGFIPHDIMIVDFMKCMRDCFINQAVEQRILPKRHEYAVVFRKP